MHELSIAESILDAVRKEIAMRPGTIPVRVGVRIGSMAAIDAEALTFCFSAVVHGTEWDALKLDTNVVPARRVCNDCGDSFLVEDYNAVCPGCASENTAADGGDELDLEYLEVETNGAPVP
ncbi:MAG TPA: hydrogenase maturation nickel metallochaperone HypA [Acidisarcina sp.]|nr:hydrogenase maturation nickel metallochaperone HypA [Acidisarcina sp.]